MIEFKPATRLTDWFDAILILTDGSAAISPWLDLLKSKLPVIVAQAEEGASRLIRKCEVDGVASYARPISVDQQDAVELRRLLQTRGVKRPLVWVMDPSAAALGEAWREPFRVLCAGPDMAAAGAALNHYDMVIAADSASAAGLRRDSGLIRSALPASATEEGLATAEAAICEALNGMRAREKHLNVLVLYDDLFTNTETIFEHLSAFATHSRHNYYFLPVVELSEDMFGKYRNGRWPQAWNLEMFDVVIWHFVLPAYLKDRLPPVVAEEMAKFQGLKVLFVQDEYDSTHNIWDAIRKTGVNLVMTCVPPEGRDFVYPPAELPGVEFIQNFTGYVPENQLDQYIQPLEARDTRIGYRGRMLASRYGRLGREKYDIGVRMKDIADERGVPVDIEVDDWRRIYGADWYRFLGSARATLATESGSNVFDFDGSLKPLSLKADEDGEDFEVFHANYLGDKDGIVTMNQVSPKIFEAIRLRTALVCFEGGYSGVIQPDIHYIPLKKDYSNIDDVLAKLEDVDYLKALTDRAYRDVIDTGRYSYATFVRTFDDIVDGRSLRDSRSEIISTPLLVRDRSRREFDVMIRPDPMQYALNTGILRPPLQRPQLAAAVTLTREFEAEPRKGRPPTPPSDAVVAHSISHERLTNIYWQAAGSLLEPIEGGVRMTTPELAYHYAAWSPFDLSRVSTTHEFCWLELDLADLEGEIGVSFYDNATDTIHADHWISNRAGEFTYRVDLRDAAGDHLLLRTSPTGQSAQVTFRAARVLTIPAYREDVIAIARMLAKVPSGILGWWEGAPPPLKTPTSRSASTAPVAHPDPPKAR